MRHYLACYDIRHPSRLKAALAILLDYASSRQYSVFECSLTDRDRDELIHRMALILEEEDGFALLPILHDGPIKNLGQISWQSTVNALFID